MNGQQGWEPPGWLVYAVVLLVGCLLVGTQPGRVVLDQFRSQVRSQQGGGQFSDLFGGLGGGRLPKVQVGRNPHAPDQARHLLRSDQVSLTTGARRDLESGQVNKCLVSLLAGLSQRHSYTIWVIKTGHDKYVDGTDRVSNHYVWEGADIGVVDGQRVDPGNTRARAAAIWLLKAEYGSCRADEVGSPWPLDGVNRVAFTNAAHQNHLHLGV